MNPFALWFQAWASILSPMISRASQREVDLQFNTDRKPWKCLTPEEKFVRRLTDSVEVTKAMLEPDKDK